VSRDGLAALAERGEPDFGQPDEQIVYRLATEILGAHFVSDDTFTQAVAVLGEQGVVDLIGCLGNFSMLAMLLNTFQVDLQPVEPPFPDVHGFARVPAGQPVAER
jgi:4-carboxymuconolactone decarboxylase